MYHHITLLRQPCPPASHGGAAALCTPWQSMAGSGYPVLGTTRQQAPALDYALPFAPHHNHNLEREQQAAHQAERRHAPPVPVLFRASHAHPKGKYSRLSVPHAICPNFFFQPTWSLAALRPDPHSSCFCDLCSMFFRNPIGSRLCPHVMLTEASHQSREWSGNGQGANHVMGGSCRDAGWRSCQG